MLSCEICKVFTNTYFYRTPSVVASRLEIKACINSFIFLNLLRTLTIFKRWNCIWNPSRRCHFKKLMFFTQKRRHSAVTFARLKERCCAISRSIKRSWLPRLWIFNCGISLLMVSFSRNNMVNDPHNRNLETEINEPYGTLKNNIYIKTFIW